MSLINEALNRARVESASEQGGPRMDLHAVVSPSAPRGGLKVTSLLLATVVLLAMGVVAVLLVGWNRTPQQAGAKTKPSGTVGVVNENTGTIGADGLENGNGLNENTGGTETSIAHADAGTDAATAQSDEQPQDPWSLEGQAQDVRHGLLANRRTRMEELAKLSRASGANGKAGLYEKSILNEVVEQVLNSQANDAKQDASSQGDARSGASSQGDPIQGASNQPSPELIAAVVKALEADRAKQAEADAKQKDQAVSPSESDGNTSADKQNPSPQPAKTAASRYPTFVGEVVDERFPYLKISGITQSNTQQCVLINNKILLLGDEVDNVSVERIERKRVRLKYRGQVFLLELP